MNDVELREISLENLDEVIDLQVAMEQAHLVADNLYSIAQSGLDPFGICRAAYADDEPIGFFYTRILNQGQLMYIRRFMVDWRQQRRGYGRGMMMKLLASAFSSPRLEAADLAVSRDTGGAEDFYRKCGFVSLDERYRGGWRMVLTRERYFKQRASE